MAQTKLRTIARVGLVTSAMGMVALFLPFTYDTSPIKGLQDLDRVWMLALPFFVVLLTWYQSIRLIRTGAMSLADRRWALIQSLSIVLLTASFYVLPGDGPSWSSTWRERASFVTPLVLIVAGSALLWRLRRRVSPDLLAMAMAICAYLPNAVLCLIEFRENWQAGAEVTLATAVGYALTLVLIARAQGAGQAG